MRGKLFVIIAVVVVVGIGVLWGARRGGAPPASPSTLGDAADVSPRVSPEELQRELETLKAMQNHLLPPKLAPASDALVGAGGASGPAANPDALRTGPAAGAPQRFVPPPAQKPPSAYTYPSVYSAPQATSSQQYPSIYTYSSASGNSPQAGGAPASTTPMFTAAPGTRTFTVTGTRFCGYRAGASTVILSGYPFVQDPEVYPQDIVSWSDTQVVFRLPRTFPAGKYALTVRGRNNYGYCSDVKPGIIKVE